MYITPNISTVAIAGFIIIAVIFNFKLKHLRIAIKFNIITRIYAAFELIAEPYILISGIAIRYQLIESFTALPQSAVKNGSIIFPADCNIADVICVTHIIITHGAIAVSIADDELL